jgi:hypothetical protein
VGWIDLVTELRLVILDVKAAGVEQLLRAAGELDLDDRIPAAVRNEGTGAMTVGEMRLPVIDHRTKPLKASTPATAGRSAPSAIA